MPKEHEVQDTPVRAIRLAFSSIDEVNAYLNFMEDNAIKWRPDFDSSSFVYSPEDADKILAGLSGEDVSDLFNQLRNLNAGYQILRVGREVTGMPKPTRMIIKDHHTGAYLICDYGRIEHGIPENAVIDILCSGGYTEVMATRPPQIFDTLDQLFKCQKLSRKVHDSGN